MFTFSFAIKLIIFLKAYECSMKTFVENCQLPKGCKWEDKKHWLVEETIVCKNLRSKINLDKCNLTNKTSNRITDMYNINLMLNEKVDNNYILNNDFNLHKIIDFINSTIGSSITFVNLKGFRSDLSLVLNMNRITIMFYDIEFDFYNRDGKVIKTCEEYKNSIGNLTKNFILSDTKRYFKASFLNTQFKTPVCPLIFEKAKISILQFSHLVKSYYRRNTINFLDDFNKSKLNAEIEMYMLDNFYGLDLDFKLINKEIFRETMVFQFDGVINSIHTDLFKTFENVKYIEFNPIFLLDVIRKQGIDWMKSINYGIKANLSDPVSLEINMEQSKEIKFIIDNVLDFLYNNKAQFFYDEDFCLFKDFPFEQLIIINVNLVFNEDKLHLSCTTVWLVQYYQLYYQYSKSIFLKFEIDHTLKTIKENSLIEKCVFKTRLKQCNRSNFEIIRKRSTTNAFDFMIISQFLLVIFTPIVCLFGIVTNTLIVITVIHKKNRKELKEKQYTYMAINSITNILILFIQILSLMNECQYPFGIFCSSIRKYPVIQYFKIVFGETVSSFLRLISNFTYLAFSINRLSLVGKNGDFIEYFSKLAVYKYMIFSGVLSATFSIVKGFRFKLNSFEPNELYPLIFYKDSLYYLVNYKVIYILLFAFDAVYTLINYIIFTLIHLVFDILLFHKIRKTIKEKEVKYKTIYLLIDNQYSKKLKENQETIRKVLTMVILSALVNLILKIPISITSLNDLRLMINTPFHQLFSGFMSVRELFKFPYDMRTICYFDEICLIFESFGNFLFLISLAINIFFYYKFDKKFHLSFNTAFGVNVLVKK